MRKGRQRLRGKSERWDHRHLVGQVSLHQGEPALRPLSLISRCQGWPGQRFVRWPGQSWCRLCVESGAKPTESGGSQTEVAAAWAAIAGETSTAPAKSLPRSTGTTSTFIPGSGAWIALPPPR
jgi:hypothetical protein